LGCGALGTVTHLAVAAGCRAVFIPVLTDGDGDGETAGSGWARGRAGRGRTAFRAASGQSAKGEWPRAENRVFGGASPDCKVRAPYIKIWRSELFRAKTRVEFRGHHTYFLEFRWNSGDVYEQAVVKTVAGIFRGSSKHLFGNSGVRNLGVRHYVKLLRPLVAIGHVSAFRRLSSLLCALGVSVVKKCSSQ